jgi:hypothetical protein
MKRIVRGHRQIRLLAFFIVVAIAGSGGQQSRASDHQDGTLTGGLALALDPTADINDLFAWMSTDATKVNLAMSLFPNATATTRFSDAVKYVFHTASVSTYLGASVPRDIICTFNNATPQVASCWVTDPTDATGASVKAFVTGDASGTAGVMNTDGSVKVFAGPRADPFFFNLAGFKNGTAAVAAAVREAGATSNGTYIKGIDTGHPGCPILTTAARDAVVGFLSHDCTGTGSPVDFFKKTAAADNAACVTKPALVNTQAQNSGLTGNILSLVIQVNKSLLTTGGPVLNVWAATTR